MEEVLELVFKMNNIQIKELKKASKSLRQIKKSIDRILDETEPKGCKEEQE